MTKAEVKLGFWTLIQGRGGRKDTGLMWLHCSAPSELDVQITTWDIETWLPAPALPLTCPVALGEILCLSFPSFKWG